MSFLQKHSVLRLNALYQVLGVTTPQAALIAMSGTSARAINVIYAFNPDNSYDYENSYWAPVSLEEWLSLPIRDGIDNIIHTSKIQLRSPTVIITDYAKMPTRRFRPNKTTLLQMQNFRCGYTNQPLTAKNSNLEHVRPKSFGGKDTFENLLVVKKEINSKRGNKPLEELNLYPLFRHKTPLPIPAHYTIKSVLHPDWRFFINR